MNSPPTGLTRAASHHSRCKPLSGADAHSDFGRANQGHSGGPPPGDTGLLAALAEADPELSSYCIRAAERDTQLAGRYATTLPGLSFVKWDQRFHSGEQALSNEVRRSFALSSECQPPGSLDSWIKPPASLILPRAANLPTYRLGDTKWPDQQSTWTL